MIFIELYIPKGTLNAERRRTLGERLIAEIVKADDAPAAVIADSRAISQVVIHEPEQWIVGNKTLEVGEPARYVARISVPGPWRKDISEHLITVTTRVLAEMDDDPQRLYKEPHAWIFVTAIAEGSCGTQGRVVSANDITRMITRSVREAPEGSMPVRELAPGTAVDPVCGAVVPFNEHAVTIEHDGTLYAFCCQGCRAVFMEDHALAR